MRTIPDYDAHVREIARRFGIHLIVDPALAPHQAAAIDVMDMARLPLPDLVVCGPVTDETTYAVALHELGHCAAPNGMLGREKLAALRRGDRAELENLRVTEEEAAWAWAQRVALEWTGPMEWVRDWALASYRSEQARAVRAAVRVKRAAVRGAAVLRGMLGKR